MQNENKDKQPSKSRKRNRNNRRRNRKRKWREMNQNSNTDTNQQKSNQTNKNTQQNTSHDISVFDEWKEIQKLEKLPFANNANNTAWLAPKITNNNVRNNNKYQQKNKIYANPYSSQYFDTHCHMENILWKNGCGLRDFSTFRTTNFKGNFGGCITIACSKESIKPISQLITDNANIYATFGLHPHLAKEWDLDLKHSILNALQNKTSIVKENDWECAYCQHRNPMEYVFCEQCFLEKINDNKIANDTSAVSTNISSEKNENENELKNDSTQKSLPQLSLKRKIVAVGECGLDFHYNRSSHDLQKRAFVEQIKMSEMLDLPLVIHSREAERDTIEIMKKFCSSNRKIHLHCFTDSLKMANVMQEEFKNLFIGITGAVTFPGKNGINRMANAVANVSLDRLLLETDGPYMAPVPYRFTKISHPGYIPLVAEKIAQIKGISDVNQVLKQCRANAFKMYGV